MCGSPCLLVYDMAGSYTWVYGRKKNTMTDKQWYFNSVTQQPEFGPVSPIAQRMGPYATREDALKAWQIVEERNKEWNDADRQWEEAGLKPTDPSDEAKPQEHNQGTTN